MPSFKYLPILKTKNILYQNKKLILFEIITYNNQVNKNVQFTVIITRPNAIKNRHLKYFVYRCFYLNTYANREGNIEIEYTIKVKFIKFMYV